MNSLLIFKKINLLIDNLFIFLVKSNYKTLIKGDDFLKTCFVDYRISNIEEENLKKLNLNIVKVLKNPNLYEAIDGHPDIQLNIVDEKKIIVSKNSSEEFLNSIPKDISIVRSLCDLGYEYPKNISLNGVTLKNTFIHNLKFTDENLLKNLGNKNLININQGYAKCSIAVVSEKALITSDYGIYKTLKTKGFDLLLIPSGDIILEGLNYGFIGGTCGLISKNKMVFYGNLKNHSYGYDIEKFLSKYDVEPIYLSSSKLVDRGSILTI